MICGHLPKINKRESLLERWCQAVNFDPQVTAKKLLLFYTKNCSSTSRDIIFLSMKVITEKLRFFPWKLLQKSCGSADKKIKTSHSYVKMRFFCEADNKRQNIIIIIKPSSCMRAQNEPQWSSFTTVWLIYWSHSSWSFTLKVRKQYFWRCYAGTLQHQNTWNLHPHETSISASVPSNTS